MKKIDSLIVLSLFILSACDEPGKGQPVEQQGSNPDQKQVSEIIEGNRGIPTTVTPEFKDTEAGVLKASFEIRIRDQVEIDTVNFQGKEISIVDAPATFDQTFSIFHPRDVSDEDADLIQDITEEAMNQTIAKNKDGVIFIDRSVDKLSTSVGNFFGRFFDFKISSEREYPSLYNTNHSLQKESFQQMLNAIEEEDQDTFVSNLAVLATYFDEKHRSESLDFIKTFSHLFVTHQFPSEGCRQMYFNAILRSGEISIISAQHENS